MEEVLSVSLPIFGLCLVGYLAARVGMFSAQAGEGLARFVFDWAIPFALFRLFATQTLPGEFPWALLASFYLPVLALYAVVFFGSGSVFGLGAQTRVIAAMGSTYGNSVLLGLPIMLLIFGEEGTVPFLVLISVHSLILLGLSAALLDYGKLGPTRKRLYRTLARELGSNPILVGIVGGLAFNLLGLSLPRPVDAISAYMQDAVAACSLFVLGVALTRYSVVGQLRQTGSVVLAKNFVLPILVWVLADPILELTASEVTAAVVLAALPTGINIYLFAERYGAGQRLAAATVFLSSVICVFTLTVVLLLLRGRY